MKGLSDEEIRMQFEQQEAMINQLKDMIRDREAELKKKEDDEQSQVQDMFAQLLFKDKKIMELDNLVQEKDRLIMDAQETVEEKTEVIRARDKAIQLMRDAQQASTDDLSTQFEGKLAATQAYFEESLSERDSQVTALQSTVRRQQEELHLRDQDMMQLFQRHEADVARLHETFSRGDTGAATALLRQQLQEANEMITSKVQAVQILQSELSTKEDEMQKKEDSLRERREAMHKLQDELETVKKNAAQSEESMRKDIENFKKEVSGEKKKHLTAKAKAKSLEKQMDALKKKLSAAESEALVKAEDSSATKATNEVLEEEKSKNERLEKELRDVNGKLTESQEQLANQSRELQQLRQSAASLDSLAHNKALGQDNVRLSTELVDKEGIIEELQTELKRFKDERESNEAELSVKTEMIEKLHELVTELQRTEETMKDTLEAKHVEWHDQRSQYENQVYELHQKIEDLTTTAHNLQTQISEKDEIFTNIDGLNNNLKKMLSDAEDTVANYENKLKEMAQSNVNLKEKCDTLSDKIDSLQAAGSIMESELSEKETEWNDIVQKYRLEIQNISEEKTHLLETAQRYEMQLEELTANLAEQTDKCGILQHNLRDLQDESDGMRAALDKNEEFLVAKDNHIKQLEEKTEQFGENQAILEENVKTLKRELEEQCEGLNEEKKNFEKELLSKDQSWQESIEKYREQLQTLTDEKLHLLETSKRYETQIEALTEESDQVHQNLEDAQGEMRGLRSTLLEKDELLETRETLILQLQDHIREKEEHLDIGRSELEKSQENTQSLQNELRSQIQSLQESLAVKNKELDEVRTESGTNVQRLENELLDLAEEKSHLLETSQRYENQIQALTTEWETTQQNVEELEKQIQELRISLNSKDELLASRDSQISQLEDRIHEKQQQLEIRSQEYEKSFEDSLSEHNDMKTQLINQQQQIVSLKEENSGITEKLHSKEEMQKQYHSQLENVSSALSEQNKRCEDLEEKIRMLDKDASDMSTRLRDKEELLESRQMLVVQLQDHIRKKEQHLDLGRIEFEKIVGSSQSAQDELSRNLQESEAQISDLQSSLNQVREELELERTSKGLLEEQMSTKDSEWSNVIQKYKAELSNVSDSLCASQEEVNRRCRQVEELNGLLTSHGEQEQSWLDERRQLSAKSESYQSLLQDAQGACDQLRSVIVEKDIRLADLVEERDELMATISKIRDSQAHMETIVQTNRAELSAQVAGYLQQLETASDINVKLRTRAEEQDQMLTDLSQALSDAEKDREVLRRTTDDLTSEVEAMREQVTRVSSIEKDRERLRSEVDRLTPTTAQLDELQGVVSRLAAERNILQEEVNHYQTLTPQVDELKTSVMRLEDENKRLQELAASASQLEQINEEQGKKLEVQERVWTEELRRLTECAETQKRVATEAVGNQETLKTEVEKLKEEVAQLNAGRDDVTQTQEFKKLREKWAKLVRTCRSLKEENERLGGSSSRAEAEVDETAIQPQQASQVTQDKPIDTARMKERYAKLVKQCKVYKESLRQVQEELDEKTAVLNSICQHAEVEEVHELSTRIEELLRATRVPEHYQQLEEENQEYREEVERFRLVVEESAAQYDEIVTDNERLRLEAADATANFEAAHDAVNKMKRQERDSRNETERLLGLLSQTSNQLDSTNAEVERLRAALRDNNSQDEVQRLLQLLADSAGQLDNANLETEHFKKLAAQSEEQLRRYFEEVKHLADNNSGLQQQIVEYRESLEQTKGDCEHYRLTAEDVAAKLNAVEAAADSRQAEIDRLLGLHSQTSKQLEEMNAENERLVLERQDWTKKLHESQSESERLLGLLTQSSSQVDVANAEVERLRIEILNSSSRDGRAIEEALQLKQANDNSQTEIERLLGLVNDSATQLEEANAKVAHHSQACSEAQEELQHSQTEVERLLNLVSESAAELDEANNKVELHTQANADAQKEVEEAQAEIVRLTELLEETQSKVVTKDSQPEIERLLSLVSESAMQLDEANRKVECQAQASSEAQKKLEESETEISRLSALLEEAEGEMKNLKLEAEDSSSNFEAAHMTVEKLKSEAEDLRARLVEAEKLEEKASGLTEELEKSHAEVERLLQLLSQSAEQLDEANTEVERLRSELMVNLSQRDEGDTQLIQLKESRDQAQHEVERLSELLDVSSNEMEEASRKAQLLETNSLRSQEELGKSQAEVGRLLELLTQSSAQLDNANAEVERIRNEMTNSRSEEVDELQQRCSYLERQLEDSRFEATETAIVQQSSTKLEAERSESQPRGDPEPEIERLSNLVSESAMQLDEANRKVECQAQECDEAQKKVEESQAEIVRLTGLLEETQSKVVTKDALQDSQPEIERLLSLVSESARQLDEANRKVECQAQTSAEAHRKLEESATEISRLSALLEEAEDELKNMKLEAEDSSSNFEAAHMAVEKLKSEAEDLRARLVEAEKSEEKASELSEDLEKSHAELERLLQLLSHSAEQLDEANTEVERLKAQVQENDEMHAAIENVMSKLEEACDAEVQKLQAHLHNVEDELEASRRQIQDLMASEREARDAVLHLRSELESVERRGQIREDEDPDSEMIRLREWNGSLSDMNEALKLTIAEKEDQVTDLMRDVEEMKRGRKEALIRAERAEKEAASRAAELRTLRAFSPPCVEERDIRSPQSDLERPFSPLMSSTLSGEGEASMAQLLAQLTRAESTVNEMEVSLAERDTRISVLEKEAGEGSAQMEAAIRLMKSLEARLEASNKQLRVLTTQGRRSGPNLAEVMEQVDDMYAMFEEAEAERLAYEGKVVRATKLIAQLKSSVRDKENELIQMRQRLAKPEVQSSSTQATIISLDAGVQTGLGSWSEHSERSASPNSADGEGSGQEAAVRSLKAQLNRMRVQMDQLAAERGRIQAEYMRMRKARDDSEREVRRLSAEREIMSPPPSVIPMQTTPDSSASIEETVERAVNAVRQEAASQVASLQRTLNQRETKCRKMEFKIGAQREKILSLQLRLDEKDQELDHTVDHIRLSLAAHEKERAHWLHERRCLQEVLAQRERQAMALEAGLKQKQQQVDDRLANTYLEEVRTLRSELQVLQKEKEQQTASMEAQKVNFEGRMHELQTDNRELKGRLERNFSRSQRQGDAEEEEVEKEVKTAASDSEKGRRYYELLTALQLKEEALSASDGQLQAMETELSNVQRRLEEDSKEKEEAFSNLKEKYGKLVHQCRVFKQTVRSLEEDNERVNEELECLRNAKNEAEESATNFETRFIQLQNHHQTLVQHLAAKDEEVAELAVKEDDVSQLSAQLQAKEDDVAKLAQQLQMKDEELATVTSRLQSKDEDLAIVKSQLESKYEELSAVNSQLQSKDEELSTVTSQLQSKDEDLAVVTSRLQTKEDKVRNSEEMVHLKEEEIIELSSRLNEMNDQISRMRESVTDLSSAVSDKDETISKLHGKLEMKDEELAKLLQKFENEEKDQRESEMVKIVETPLNVPTVSETVLVKSGDPSSTYPDDESQLTEQIQTLEQTINDLRSEIEVKESDRNQLTLSLEKKTEEISTLCDTVGQKDAQIMQLTANVTELSSVIESKDHDTSSLTEQLKETSEAHEQLLAEMEQKRTEVSRLNSLLKIKEEDSDDNSTQVRELTSDLRAKESIISQLREQLEFANQNQSLMLEQKNNDVSQMTSQLEHKNEKISQLISELDSKTEDMSALTYQLDSKNEALSVLSSQLDSKDAEISLLNSKVDANNNQISELISDVDARDEEISSLESQLDEKKGEISDLTVELEGKREEIQQLTSQLDTNNEEMAMIVAGNDSKDNGDVLSQSLLDKDAEIFELTTNLEVTEAKLAQNISIMEKKDGRIAQLVSQLAEKEDEMSQLASEMERKEIEVSELANARTTLKENSEMQTEEEDWERSQRKDIEAERANDMNFELMSILREKEEDISALRAEINSLRTVEGDPVNQLARQEMFSWLQRELQPQLEDRSCQTEVIEASDWDTEDLVLDDEVEKLMFVGQSSEVESGQKENVALLQQRVSDLEWRVMELEDELKTTKRENERLSAAASSLLDKEMELETLKLDKEALVQQIKMLESSEGQERADSPSVVSNLNEELEEARTELNTLRQHLEQSNEAFLNQKEALQYGEEERRHLETQVGQLNEQVEEMLQFNKSVNNELRQVREASHGSANSSHESEMGFMKEELQAALQSTHDKHLRVQTLQMQVSKLSRENRHLQLQVHSLQRRGQLPPISSASSASESSGRNSESNSESSDAAPRSSQGASVPTTQAEFVEVLRAKDDEIEDLSKRLFVATDQLITLRSFMSRHASVVTQDHLRTDTDYETTDTESKEARPSDFSAVQIGDDDEVRIPMEATPLLSRSQFSFPRRLIQYIQSRRLLCRSQPRFSPRIVTAYILFLHLLVLYLIAV